MTKPTDPQPRRNEPADHARSQPTPLRGAPAPSTPFKRNDSDLLDHSLQSFSEVWMSGLPDSVRPTNCAQHYPRVLNKIAALWSLNERCIDYLNGLIVDARPDRQGFSYGVLGELRRLRAHRVATMQTPTSLELAEPQGHTDFLNTVPMAPDDWPPKR